MVEVVRFTAICRLTFLLLGMILVIAILIFWVLLFLVRPILLVLPLLVVPVMLIMRRLRMVNPVCLFPLAPLIRSRHRLSAMRVQLPWS
jgi:hypothetical protein